MKVYVASFATRADYDAECDDPSARDGSIADLASPQFHAISASFTPEWVEQLLFEAKEEAAYIYDGGELDACTLRSDGWTVPENGRPNQVWELYDDEEDVLLSIVVQEVELQS